MCIRDRFKGKPTAKRATRKAQVNITLMDLGAGGVSVQVNGKEVWLAPDMAGAEADAAHREARSKALGKTVSTTRF